MGATADGVRLARLDGRHPGAESDYILGDVSWLRGREYNLYDRDDDMARGRPDAR